MKKDLKMHPGFTIAELLVSMLIVMLVASAMVPIVGPKKLRTLTTRFNHGIAACYWDEGRLMYLYADNGPHRNASPTQMGGGATSCSYNVPQANHYTIYAIGAGADGAGNNGNGIRATITLQERFGNTIGLSNFQRDIGGKVSNTVGNENDTLLPGEPSFLMALQNTFTDWAKSINAGRVLSREEARDYDPTTPAHRNNRYLYAQFSGLQGPIGAGGAGYSEIRFINDNEGICGLCVVNGNCRGPQLHNGSFYFIGNMYKIPISSSIVAAETAATYESECNRNCFYYLNARGGHSGQRTQITNMDTPVLFPIDAQTNIEASASPTGFYYEINRNANGDPTSQQNTVMLPNISETNIAVVSTNGFSNSVRLTSSAPGRNGGPGGSGANGVNGNNFARAVVTNGGGLRARFGNTNLTNSHFSDANGARNLGAPNGPNQPNNNILFPDQRTGTAGSITFDNQNGAFSWSVREPQATVRYGTAGTHGDIKEMSFANLTGILTLVPGRNNNNGFSHTQVLNGNNEEIINAPSQNTGGEIRSLNGSYSIRDEGGDTPRIPPERVRNLTMPNNDVFGAFLNRVRSIDFDNRNNNRLANCGQQGGMACPGYAGSGAYPVINDDIFYRLILSNNQTYARTANALEQSFTRDYQAVEPFRQDDNNIVCLDGFTRKNSGNISYCTEEGARRGDGAVVIIW